VKLSELSHNGRNLKVAVPLTKGRKRSPKNLMGRSRELTLLAERILSGAAPGTDPVTGLLKGRSLQGGGGEGNQRRGGKKGRVLPLGSWSKGTQKISAGKKVVSGGKVQSLPIKVTEWGRTAKNKKKKTLKERILQEDGDVAWFGLIRCVLRKVRDEKSRALGRGESEKKGLVLRTWVKDRDGGPSVGGLLYLKGLCQTDTDPSCSWSALITGKNRKECGILGEAGRGSREGPG